MRSMNDFLDDADAATRGPVSIFDRAVVQSVPTRGTHLSRRGFIKIAAGASGGLILGLALPHEQASAQVGAAAPATPPFKPSAYVRIAPSGSVTLYAKNPEIGQGIRTAFGLILAEELDARWSDVTVEQAPIDAAVYGTQSSGGSRSIPSSWMTLRQAGAGARSMLVAAAAKHWQVPMSELTTSESTVHHPASGRTASYGSLASAAASLPVPDVRTLQLKERKDFKLLGKRHSGVDNQRIVTGQPLFGIDVQVPGMLFAVFCKCPAVYGRVQSANVDEIRRLPGVKDAFIVAGTGKPTEILSGVAIVATSTWAALSARRRLQVTWDESAASQDSWTSFVTQANAHAERQEGAQVVQTIGNVEEGFASGSHLRSRYTYGFVAHGQLEPQNCTAWYKKDVSGESLEVWAPTQTPTRARTHVAEVLGIAVDKVTLHQCRCGGGFGRRLNNDYVIEAAQISKQAGGVPVKLMWTREDDMEHDFYRPGGFMVFKAALTEQGRISAWESHLIHFKSEGGTAVSAANWQLNEFPAGYVPAYKASQTLMPLKIPTGSWRAPGSNTAAWVVQSFLHELSVAAKRDHVELLLEIAGSRTPEGLAEGAGRSPHVPERAAGVIRVAAQRAGWGRRELPAGHALGIAFHFSHQGHFAEVAEVSVAASKKITIHKVWVVGDIGPIVDLSSAENQCQGSVIDAISTMSLEVTMEKGRIEQTNFDRYPLGRLPITPEIDVHFLDTDYPPTGVGEPALPPLAPAVCNAVYAATGHRIRTLPITREGFSI